MVLNSKHKKLIAIIGILLVIIIIAKEPTIIKEFLRDIFVSPFLNNKL